MVRIAVAVLLGAAAAPLVHANDFPTHARAEFVLACMRENGMQQETLYKCSCAIDAIAARMNYEAWVDLSTVAQGITIAGERGGVMRDIKDGRKQAATFREIQDQSKKGCFLGK